MTTQTPSLASDVRTLVLASRPVSWINTAFPFAAAYLLTTREIDLVLVVGTIYFLVPYNLAMYGINDVFDYESDLANPRKGGVEGAPAAAPSPQVGDHPEQQRPAQQRADDQGEPLQTSSDVVVPCLPGHLPQQAGH